MTIRNAYDCNICGATRKVANHWFVAKFSKTQLQIVPWDVAMVEGHISEAEAIHLCGQVCAHTLLDRFLTQKGEDNDEGKTV